MSDTVIDVRNLSKMFRISREPTHTVKEAAIRFLKRQLSYDEFWALRDVSFSIKKGESVGIIGRNGSGKSTLFKLISGVLKPTSGSISVQGRISPMIELTAGFHSELTGIENIYLNCSIYGMTRAETKRKAEKIIDFAGIGEFIYSPVRVYSSGMLARLGFAIAVNVDADILLVDEVLAVGDGEFQRKCIYKLQQLKENDVSIVFVSHNLRTVEQVCEKSIWLNNGAMKSIGDSKKIVAEYYECAAKNK